MKPSLRIIAERAGVSTATVSRALNDRAGVNPETREQILRIATELGYAPSMPARGLATSRTYTLGLITYERQPQPIASYHIEILRGADEEARRHGYHVIITFVDRDGMADANHLPLLMEQRIDGLILVGPSLKTSFILQLHRSDVPIVLVDNLLNETNIDAVVCDNLMGTYHVTRHLIEQHGRRRLAFFSGPADWFSSRQRRQGYERALAEIGATPCVFHMPDTTINMGQAMMHQALVAMRDLDGVVAVNDATAVGVIRACKEAGRRVPDEISVVGFDNVAWGSLHEPSLTTVGMFKHETGVQAARRLIDVIERGPSPGIEIKLGTELILRESCGCTRPPNSLMPDHGS